MMPTEVPEEVVTQYRKEFLAAIEQPDVVTAKLTIDDRYARVFIKYSDGERVDKIFDLRNLDWDE